jgi:hypothetical protein
MTVSAEDVTRATEAACAALRPAVDQDWGVPAGSIEWSCRRTGEHVADSLLWYATQLLGEHADRFLTFELKLEDGTDTSTLVDIVEATGRVLAVAVAAAPDTARAYHAFGVGDREAFAAMGVLETCLHTYDIAQGLHCAWNPPDDLCDKVLDRLLRDRPDHSDAWESLLWCSGRIALPGLPRRESWRWWNEPTTA